MNQAQHDCIEGVIADNPAFLVECHEKPWGVVADIRQQVPTRESWRTGALIAVFADGSWARDTALPIRKADWPKGARTTRELQRFAA